MNEDTTYTLYFWNKEKGDWFQPPIVGDIKNLLTGFTGLTRCIDNFKENVTKTIYINQDFGFTDSFWQQNGILLNPAFNLIKPIPFELFEIQNIISWFDFAGIQDYSAGLSLTHDINFWLYTEFYCNSIDSYPPLEWVVDSLEVCRCLAIDPFHYEYKDIRYVGVIPQAIKLHYLENLKQKKL